MREDYNNTTEIMPARNLYKSDDSLIPRGIIRVRYLHLRDELVYKSGFHSRPQGAIIKYPQLKLLRPHPRGN
jgi:hypothetical protein